MWLVLQAEAAEKQAAAIEKRVEAAEKRVSAFPVLPPCSFMEIVLHFVLHFVFLCRLSHRNLNSLRGTVPSHSWKLGLTS